LYRKDEIAVEVLVQAVVVAFLVFEDQGRRALLAGGVAAGDALDPQIRGRRLQLPAPGPLRRFRLSGTGDGIAERSGTRLRRRRIHARRAAPADAVEG